MAVAAGAGVDKGAEVRSGVAEAIKFAVGDGIGVPGCGEASPHATASAVTAASAPRRITRSARRPALAYGVHEARGG